MGKVVYAKITTNRATLVRYIENFRKMKVPSESLAAPRPLAGTTQISYYALLALEQDSQLHSYFSGLKKLTMMNRTEYERELAILKHHWSA